MVNLSDIRTSDFYDNLLDGYYFKEIVRTVLDASDYMVFPYGYESAFSYIKIQLHKGEIKNTHTAKKIRSSPDLLVYDQSEKEIKLVEVKSRNWDDEENVSIPSRIDWYKRYWEGSILTVIIPHGHWFYAQCIDNLEVKNSYNLRDDFKKFEAIFTKVNTDILYRFKSNVAEKMGRTNNNTAFYFPEKYDEFFLPELLRLVQKNRGKTKDQLFDIYNSENLVSMKLFTEGLEKSVHERKIHSIKDRFYPHRNT